ncbi:MAG: LLM class flavin-dependent oxidoreductase, partial [Deltaproteobacteria bacterium]|nr:LLM class flavin-dependent oxidoreductase [Deltaproteobacteria bacterium]
MDIGQVGVWTRTDGLSTARAIEFAQRVEELGYGALWIPDAFGRDPFAHAALLFAHTSRLVIATGVVNIHLREAQATACAQKTLHDQSGGRFLLGLGVSHGTAIEALFDKPYPKPLPSMR